MIEIENLKKKAQSGVEEIKNFWPDDLDDITLVNQIHYQIIKSIKNSIFHVRRIDDISISDREILALWALTVLSADDGVILIQNIFYITVLTLIYYKKNCIEYEREHRGKSNPYLEPLTKMLEALNLSTGIVGLNIKSALHTILREIFVDNVLTVGDVLLTVTTAIKEMIALIPSTSVTEDEEK